MTVEQRDALLSHIAEMETRIDNVPTPGAYTCDANGVPYELSKTFVRVLCLLSRALVLTAGTS